MSLSPNDQHLVRIANKIDIDIFFAFIINLGLTTAEWEEIESYYHMNGPLGSKLMAIHKLQTKRENELKTVKFQDFSDAFERMNMYHSLCQVR